MIHSGETMVSDALSWMRKACLWMDPSASGIGRYPFWWQDDRVVSKAETATPMDTGAISTMLVRILGSLVRQILDPDSDSDVNGAIVRLTRISS